MEFTICTTYDRKAMTALARALRKTVRRKHSRRAHIFGGLVLVLGLLLTLPLGQETFEVSRRTVITWLVMLGLLIVFLREDAINGCIAQKRILPGMLSSRVTFRAGGYHSVTELGETEFHYDNIALIAETGDYFVFVFGKNHGQVYDKRDISGGTADDFRQFIQLQTGKTVRQV